MPASYPSSIVTLATHNDVTDTIFAADINTPNAEIVAIETGLLNGFQHNIIPSTDDTYSAGSTSKRWLKLWSQDIDADGTTTLGGLLDVSAAAAGQVKFPAVQNASANVNTLDDYAEGTWTPSVGGTATYTTQIGKYTKIGNLVFVAAQLVINAIGSGSTGIVSGLPYVPSVAMAGTVGYFNNIASSVVSLACYVRTTSDVVITGLTAAGPNSSNPATVFGNSAGIYFSAVYSI